MCSEHNRAPEHRHGVGLVALEREIFDKLADEVFPYSAVLTIGVGGEPTLSPNFRYFIERAWSARQDLRLITNGTRLYQEDLAEAVARCASLVQISLDGATRETYERIRRGSRWSNMQRCLTTLDRFRMQRPKRDRAELCLAFVLMRSNVHECVKFIEMAHELHADMVRMQHVIPVTEEGIAESLIHEPKLWNRWHEVALERARALGMRVMMPEPYGPEVEVVADPPPLLHLEYPEGVPGHVTRFTPDPHPELTAETAPEPLGLERTVLTGPPGSTGPAIPCSMPTLDVYVLYDGRVFPCCHPYAHAKYVMGDLRTQTFEQIWNGPEFRNLRAGLRSGDAPFACRNCSMVHDPPPAPEDPDAIASSADIATYYAGRELPAVEPKSLEGFEDALAGTSPSLRPGIGRLAKELGRIRSVRLVGTKGLRRRPEH
jgi:radical SAM protein with 4Fe4S-binding SPASM domain